MKGDNCSFRHDMNKRGKVTPSNPSPNSFMQQSERKSSRTGCPRGRSPSGRTSRWPCKDYLRGTCNNSFCEKWLDGQTSPIVTQGLIALTVLISTCAFLFFSAPAMVSRAVVCLFVPAHLSKPPSQPSKFCAKCPEI